MQVSSKLNYWFLKYFYLENLEKYNDIKFRKIKIWKIQLYKIVKYKLTTKAVPLFISYKITTCLFYKEILYIYNSVFLDIWFLIKYSINRSLCSLLYY